MSGPSRGTAAGRAYRDLQALAAREDRDTSEFLNLYALEGFLDRLSVSARSADLVLKGGVLLAAYDTRRPTRDVDLQAAATSNDTETVPALVQEIAGIDRDDGLSYDTATATAHTIREDDEYSGVRVKLTGSLATAVIPFHVDVNVGDAVWPAPAPVDVARLLGGSITVLGYSITMVLAEKIVTAVQRGTASTRWRDYADIYLLTDRQSVDGNKMGVSLRTVAEHRGTRMFSLADALVGYGDIGQTKWSAWVGKQRLAERLPENFQDAIGRAVAFADPVVHGLVADHTWDPQAAAWTEAAMPTT
ncbi:MAG: nucleotidyl transferase AbiEii/AbiGii toxin family protein [Sporichthyaceae bacterium]